jgi:hypothetical protein
MFGRHLNTMENAVQKRTLGNTIATIAASLVGIATMYLSERYLKQPQIPLDWAALAFSGLTTGLITFFVVWGHFQKDPTPDKK